MSEDANQLTAELLALWKAQILGQIGLLRTLCAAGVLAPDHAVAWLDDVAANLDLSSSLAEEFAKPLLMEARSAFARLSQ